MFGRKTVVFIICAALAAPTAAFGQAAAPAADALAKIKDEGMNRPARNRAC